MQGRGDGEAHVGENCQDVRQNHFPDAAEQGDEKNEGEDEQMAGAEWAGENDQDDTDGVGKENQ
jgi:hypothetical protein